ncbi:hypothetical protein TVAG_485690 [Trichomonas vaginalis G3]|uniref:Initiator binding domain-containing protein n=1 Tax=Trichomonas vaginalis (strain ATCC PRA-98 / G3) TaxID=412133 RepID=A2FZT1_TRIV3|nr:Initiator binding protein 39 kDa family [Trichomonas vaginalis G3]EAX89595.1 hypothetical protein TVAG_485690 [Trichomonas vaginalis G3]KAI5517577.1 Initiator binding protein 39 kDa family [Trichomonas vaginalis G3]|eukprot:XP_001302525.1 hypothetical protein [Trichomonas vaginalis G3]
MDEIPEEIRNIILKRSNKSQNSKFPFKLKTLLDWVGENENRKKKCGCSWVDDRIFSLDKAKISEIMDLKLNTLNSNLRDLGFTQALPRKEGITFWQHPNVRKNSSEEEINSIKYMDKPALENLNSLNFFGVYNVLLNNITLFGMTENEIVAFKRNVITTWEKIIKPNHVFAVSKKELTDSFGGQAGFCNDPYALQEALTTKVTAVIDINDFAIFMARFDPFENIIFKLDKFQQLIPDLRVKMTQIGSISSFFAKTYHNCFSFQMSGGEYHCYNLPHVGSTANYLQNEDGERFQSWTMALQSTSILQSQTGFFF